MSILQEKVAKSVSSRLEKMFQNYDDRSEFFEPKHLTGRFTRGGRRKSSTQNRRRRLLTPDNNFDTPKDFTANVLDTHDARRENYNPLIELGSSRFNR